MDQLADRMGRAHGASFQTPQEAKETMEKDGWVLVDMGAERMVPYDMRDFQRVLDGQLPRPLWMHFECRDEELDLTFLRRESGTYTLAVARVFEAEVPDGQTKAAIGLDADDKYLDFGVWTDMPYRTLLSMPLREVTGRVCCLASRAFPPVPDTKLKHMIDVTHAMLRNVPV